MGVGWDVFEIFGRVSGRVTSVKLQSSRSHRAVNTISSSGAGNRYILAYPYRAARIIQVGA